MISLQRSMHSSQIYTPGPAMSFFTCFWLLPQNEHFSRSPPSPMRATQPLLKTSAVPSHASFPPPRDPDTLGVRRGPREGGAIPAHRTTTDFQDMPSAWSH